MTRKCSAIGCKLKVQERMLMCRRHWYMLSRPLKRKMNKAFFNRNKGVGSASEYREAALEAIRYVADLQKLVDVGVAAYDAHLQGVITWLADEKDPRHPHKYPNHEGKVDADQA